MQEIVFALREALGGDRDLLVLGCGRSGTSAAAGILTGAGYCFGDLLEPPSRINPRGFYEDEYTVMVNEAIIRETMDRNSLQPPWSGGSLDYGKGWLLALPDGVGAVAPRPVHRIMDHMTAGKPFFRKDPRFSFTLDVWLPRLRDPVVICVFREADRTASSITRTDESRAVGMSYQAALRLWGAIYRRLIICSSRGATWLFLHYDQVLAGRLDRLVRHQTEARLREPFVDLLLSRSPSGPPLPPDINEIYQELCVLANYRSH